ncbi:BrnT family toxin [Luteibacter aegosomatissinici]|uniref:BrnT family toxin n=1 Tax=Luteibacter aegosomatissinici TaxID=2911539 RepID=UPI003CCE4793
MPPVVRGVRFEWNATKARSNLSKHKISFLDATEIFRDDFMLEQLEEPSHSEHRHRAIGVADSRILFIVFTFRGDCIRLISARKATRHETVRYWKNRLLRA